MSRTPSRSIMGEPKSPGRRLPVRKDGIRKKSLVLFKADWLRLNLSKIRIKLGTGRCSGLTLQHQEQTQWCWAAVSNSVVHFYHPGTTWSQCTIVNAELGKTTCCTAGSSAACNKPWYLDTALTRVGSLHSAASGTLTFAIVKSLIDTGRPSCARQGWSGGGGHFMAIVCYYEGARGLALGAASTARRLRISDPWYGDSVVDYATFVSGYQGTGTWTHSYRTQP
jgi:hypothetical protein